MPFPFAILVLVLIVVYALTMFTPFGRYMYAIGNSLDAAKMLGIRVARIRVICFMLTCLMASLAPWKNCARRRCRTPQGA